MRDPVLSGGANPVDKYKIEKILGKNFQTFVGLLENPGLKAFTYDNIEPNSVGKIRDNLPEIKGNDIHQTFMQNIIGTLEGFNMVERATPGKMDVREKVLPVIEKLIDELLGDKNIIEKFYFDQLPYVPKVGSNNINYLVPNFHLLSYEDNIYYVSYDNHSSLNLAILYILHFISLLDLNNIDPKDIMLILQHDNKYFMKYIYQFYSEIVGTNLFPAGSEDNVLKAILEGFTTIVRQAINITKELDKNTPMSLTANKIKEYQDIVRSLDVNTTKKLIKSIKGLLNDNGKGFDKKIAKKLALILLYDVDIRKQGNEVDNVFTGISPQEITARKEEYWKNSILNPYYFLGNVEKKIDIEYKLEDEVSFNILKKAIGVGQPVQPPAPPPGAGTAPLTLGVVSTLPPLVPTAKYYSLPILYGPKYVKDNNYYLTNKEEQGNVDASANEDGSFITDDALSYSKGIFEITSKKVYSSVKTIPLLTMFEYSIKVKQFYDPNHPFNKNNPPKIDQLDLNNIANNLKDMYNNYNYIANRIKQIPTRDYAKNFGQYKDPFIVSFMNYIMTHFELDKAGNLVLKPSPQPPQPGVQPQPTSKPSNFDDAVLYFFRNRALKEPDFYQKFFNLIRMEQTDEGNPDNDVLFKDVANLDDEKMQKYRLNVRKYIRGVILKGGQYGGAKTIGDIVFLTYIPDYPTDGSIGAIWVTSTIRIDEKELKNVGNEAITKIARAIYSAKEGKDVIIPNITEKITPGMVKQAGDYVATIGVFNILKSPSYIKSLLQAPLRIPGLEPGWKKRENYITEQMLKAASRWERDGDIFVLRDENGNIVEKGVNSLCNMIGQAMDNCLIFLSNCVNSNEETLPKYCEKMLDFNFNINPPINALVEMVKEINPLIAFRILQRFGFASYLAEEENEPFPGFRRYKVQSVSEWLEELLSESERCKKPTAPSSGKCDPRTLREQLGDDAANKILAILKDNTKHAFFDYLDILVDWVNANPQVLNKEEILHPEMPQEYPPIDKSFNLYNHVDPYRPIVQRLRAFRCELERLKSSIMNDLAGTRVPSTISLVAKMDASGINMPLSRTAFTSPIPSSSIVAMYGGEGGIYQTEDELKNINKQYGHGLFKLIFENLLQTMQGLSGEKKMRLKEETKRKINEKLDKLKQTEDELRKSLVNLLKKNQLFQMSRGYVDAFNITNDTDLEIVLRKHSNLLNLGNAYNRRSINLIDLFQTLIMAMVNKLQETPETPGKKYERPMTTDYRRYQSGGRRW